ncbi:hypothetical protein UFOVP661_50 [uncultured Caudovirales phage]|uniref:Uncharacterized protein n=1 Tax=uncultured Caudovirales phage TaxID=2100421 RepID=A0A6J5NC44_9CAUD|nr:hypothetical protein UFOVP661_50 [uncultured Caudovirales phage]
MSEAAKLREMMKKKAKRLSSADPHQKVDSSSWTPPEPLNADVKTGMRPVSRRAYKKGGKVMGVCGPARADRKPRKSGGKAAKTDDTPMVDRYINRDLKKANEFRDGKKHIGGMRRGGKSDASASNLNKMTTESYRRDLEKTQSTEGGEPQASDLYDKQQLERLERGYKKGGRPKKFSGGDVLKVLSPIAMLAGLGKDDDEKKARGGRNKPAKRTKRQTGGLLNDPRTAGDAILQNSAAASGVSPDRLSFAPGMPAQGMKKFLGLKTGGKAKHPDEAMDKALIRKMVKSSARKGRAEGGTLPANTGTTTAGTTTAGTTGATTGTKTTGGFLPGATGTTGTAGTTAAKTGPYSGQIASRIGATTNRLANPGSAPASYIARNQALLTRLQAADPTKEGFRAAMKGPEDARKSNAKEEKTGRGPGRRGRKAASAVEEPTKTTTGSTTTGTTTTADTATKMKPSSRYGSAAMVAAKKGGRIGKFGGGALGYAKGGNPQHRAANQASQALRRGPAAVANPADDAAAYTQQLQQDAMQQNAMQQAQQSGLMSPMYGQQNTQGMQQIPPQVMQQYLAAQQQAQQMPQGMQMGTGALSGSQSAPQAQQMPQGMQMGTGALSGSQSAPQASGKGPSASPPPGAAFNTGGRVARKKGGGVFTGSGYPGKIPGVVPGGRIARKSGGKAKGAGKTNINIVIAGKPQSDMEAPMPPMPPPGGPAAPPPMGGAPGMPPGMPPAPPMGGPGPMGRKAGGRAYKSYKDMDAGAGSGFGRLEKSEIAKRTMHKAGGKVYRSYKDMDAGAGSGLGRMEKTEIASRKRGS